MGGLWETSEFPNRSLTSRLCYGSCISAPGHIEVSIELFREAVREELVGPCKLERAKRCRVQYRRSNQRRPRISLGSTRDGTNIKAYTRK